MAAGAEEEFILDMAARRLSKDKVLSDCWYHGPPTFAQKLVTSASKDKSRSIWIASSTPTQAYASLVASERFEIFSILDESRKSRLRSGLFLRPCLHLSELTCLVAKEIWQGTIGLVH